MTTCLSDWIDVLGDGEVECQSYHCYTKFEVEEVYKSRIVSSTLIISRSININFNNQQHINHGS